MADYRLTATPGFVLHVPSGMVLNLLADGSEVDVYEAWLDAGNVPDQFVLPAPDPADLRDEAFLADTERQQILDQLRTASVADIKNWVNNNVTDLASARVMLRRIVLLLAIAVRR